MPNPDVRVRQGNRLPHWTRDGATYSVVFRLADSIPAAAAAQLTQEIARIDREAARGATVTLQELTRLARAKSDAVEKLLHAGHGECVLRREDCARTVADALRHFDGKRYTLLAWCVMPNHVHVVFRASPGEELPKILHSWKSFTAKALGKILGRTGAVWMPESYDHLVRDEIDLRHHVQYVLENPLTAGLHDWAWVWPVEKRQAFAT